MIYASAIHPIKGLVTPAQELQYCLKQGFKLSLVKLEPMLKQKIFLRGFANVAMII